MPKSQWRITFRITLPPKKVKVKPTLLKIKISVRGHLGLTTTPPPLFMKRKPLKRKSKNPHRTLMNLAVKTFNAWIRERDKKKLGRRCYTCPALGTEAGHFRHNNNATRFSEVFVNNQCSKCNRWLSGNLGQYAINLIKEHGKEKIDKLWKQSFKTKKFTMTELREIIKKYDQPNKQRTSL